LLVLELDSGPDFYAGQMTKENNMTQYEQQAREMLERHQVGRLGGGGGLVSELAGLLAKAAVLDWLEVHGKDIAIGDIAIGFPSDDDEKFYIFGNDDGGALDFVGDTLFDVVQKAMDTKCVQTDTGADKLEKEA
jgi:hypothetical protein